MTSLPTVNDWLASLDQDELASVIDLNPLTTAGARVRDLRELAARLSHPASVYEVLQAVPLPVLEVTEAASALGAAATPKTLAALLDDGGSADAATHLAQVQHWLDTAEQTALLWVDDDRIHINPGFDQIVLQPLMLGQPSRMMLDELNSDSLAGLLRSWDRTAPPRKADRLAAALPLFSDWRAIRRIAAGAPDDVLAELSEHVSRRTGRTRCISTLVGDDSSADDIFYDDADDNALLFAPGGRFDREAYRLRQERQRWVATAGLAISSTGFGLSRMTEMPSEVYVALAPDTFRAPFHPMPPEVTVTALDAEQVARSTSAALGQFLGSAMAIYEAVARDGLAVLKKGGIGTRELTRLAKRVGTDASTTRLALELGAAHELFDYAGSGRLSTSEQFQQWRRRPAHERAQQLVTTWTMLPYVPTADRDEEGKALPALAGRYRDLGIPGGLMVITTLLAQTHEVPGTSADSATVAGALSPAEVASQLTWQHPTAGVGGELFAQVWAEAHALGVVADGALAPFVPPMCAGDQDRALAAFAELLPEGDQQVLFGSDLTVVIPGDPDPDAVDVLDAVATREGHGVANTWRLSETSVRDALDAGYPVGELTEALEAIAGGPLPQTMDYLLHDVARKHGTMSVRGAAAVICSDDEALLAEIVGARKLAALGLGLAAPTVAVASAPVAEVLRRLRAAGYLPVETNTTGAPMVDVRRLPRVRSGAADGSGTADESDTDRHHADDNGVISLDAARHRRNETATAPEHAAPHPAAPSLPPILGGQTEAPADMAARLLAPPGTVDPYAGDIVGDLPQVEAMISEYNARLTPAEVHELADAEVSVRPVRLRYRSQSGGETVRTVSRLNLVGPNLFGYCHLREDDRVFTLARILEVSPALW